MSALPYISSPGNIDKALNGIRQAAVPETVSQDFVKTILKIPGGSGAEMTSFLKKLGLAKQDGSPNDRYRKFRNPSSSGTAIADALRQAYKPLYVRNEYAHELSDNELTGLVVEETGLAHDARAARMIVSCFKHLKNFADFSKTTEPASIDYKATAKDNDYDAGKNASATPTHSGIGLNLGYTINLNLPATTDVAVFDAIFRSIKKNLLSNDDA